MIATWRCLDWHVPSPIPGAVLRTCDGGQWAPGTGRRAVIMLRPGHVKDHERAPQRSCGREVADVPLAVATVMLGGFGHVAARRAGTSRASAVAWGAGSAMLGVVVILLKMSLH